MKRRSSAADGNNGLFANEEPETVRPAAYQANIDGGSRGNPGPASYGVVIRDESGEIVARLKKYIGRTTNNVAEYYGLIAALDYAQSQGVRALRIESDSELLVRQMLGHYKVKSADLRPLFERAKKMAQTFESFRIAHVYRAQNSEADALANAALDRTGEVRSTGGASNGSVAAAGPNSNTRTLRAIFRDGALHPAETLELPDGAAVEITIKIQK